MIIDKNIIRIGGEKYTLQSLLNATIAVTVSGSVYTGIVTEIQPEYDKIELTTNAGEFTLVLNLSANCITNLNNEFHLIHK